MYNQNEIKILIPFITLSCKIHAQIKLYPGKKKECRRLANPLFENEKLQFRIIILVKLTDSHVVCFTYGCLSTKILQSLLKDKDYKILDNYSIPTSKKKFFSRNSRF
jgi:hypothetical protein